MADLHLQCQLNHLEAKDLAPDQAPNQAPDLAGPALGTAPLSVGEKFLLACQGPEAELNPATLSLELPKEQQYDLKLLKNLGVDSHKASFVATSYVASDKPTEFKNIFLSDGKTRIALDGVSFTVKSVITQQNNPKHEAFGPQGLFGIAYPLWFWLSFACLLGYFLALAIEKIFLRFQRKKFFKLLSNHRPAISAYHQLSKELRQLTREQLGKQSFEAVNAAQLLRDLDQSVRWYLSRTFEFSCFDIRPIEILQKLKKQNLELEKKVGHSLLRVLIEIERLKVRAGNVKYTIKYEDAAQLIEMLRLVAEDIHKNTHSKAGYKISRARLEAEA